MERAYYRRCVGHDQGRAYLEARDTRGRLAGGARKPIRNVVRVDSRRAKPELECGAKNTDVGVGAGQRTRTVARKVPPSRAYGRWLGQRVTPAGATVQSRAAGIARLEAGRSGKRRAAAIQPV